MLSLRLRSLDQASSPSCGRRSVCLPRSPLCYCSRRRCLAELIPCPSSLPSCIENSRQPPSSSRRGQRTETGARWLSCHAVGQKETAAEACSCCSRPPDAGVPHVYFRRPKSDAWASAPACSRPHRPCACAVGAASAVTAPVVVAVVVVVVPPAPPDVPLARVVVVVVVFALVVFSVFAPLAFLRRAAPTKA